MTVMEPQRTKSGHSLRAWIQAARPFSFTASMTPVFLGAALVPYLQQSARWILFPLIILASLFIHAATNMVSEYFDYRKGVDRPDTCGGSRVLVDKRLLPKHVLMGGLSLFALTGGIGLIFVAIHGWPILLLGLIGLLGGFFYTAAPVGYKYLGFGDVLVFILMGPLMVIGSFYVLTGSYQVDILLISLPVGCLVAAILSANNLRDILHDTQAGIRSTASVLTHRWARVEYAVLIVSACLITLILIGLSVLPPWSLLTLLTIPMALKNIRAAMQSDVNQPERIAALDVQTAQLHLLFGVQLILSVLLGAFL
ncbi:MAG: 1,4-dihydroxy-2-naphthoate octaprenyltransferase [Planctomycetales bacterium]|nr:1,4-dihydroxy-2-naphthoate octaprenyltransferase [Planctomycetales bacterium]